MHLHEVVVHICVRTLSVQLPSTARFDIMVARAAMRRGFFDIFAFPTQMKPVRVPACTCRVRLNDGKHGWKEWKDGKGN